MEPIFNKYTAKCLACHTGFSAAQMKVYINLIKDWSSQDEREEEREEGEDAWWVVISKNM